jgi:hypothetical protein
MPGAAGFHGGEPCRDAWGTLPRPRQEKCDALCGRTRAEERALSRQAAPPPGKRHALHGRTQAPAAPPRQGGCRGPDAT